jgi:hypothetical protein
MKTLKQLRALNEAKKYSWTDKFDKGDYEDTRGYGGKEDPWYGKPALAARVDFVTNAAAEGFCYYAYHYMDGLGLEGSSIGLEEEVTNSKGKTAPYKLKDEDDGKINGNGVLTKAGYTYVWIEGTEEHLREIFFTRGGECWEHVKHIPRSNVKKALSSAKKTKLG